MIKERTQKLIIIIIAPFHLGNLITAKQFYNISVCVFDYIGKEWEAIIPEGDRQRVEEEERQNQLLELNLPPRIRKSIQQVSNDFTLSIPRKFL